MSMRSIPSRGKCSIIYRGLNNQINMDDLEPVPHKYPHLALPDNEPTLHLQTSQIRP
jgi:hypothetical protein